MTLLRTAKWYVSGSPGTGTPRKVDRHWWKRAVRFLPGDTAVFDASSAINYGVDDEFSFMMHFRLEGCYGGHATRRQLAKQHNGTKGWILWYDVANNLISLDVEDGIIPKVTATATYTDTDWKPWFFYFTPNAADGIKIYYGDELMVSMATTGMADIHSGTNVSLGGAVYTIAMMFGGFLFCDGHLTEAERTAIRTTHDEDWTLSTGVQIHTPGDMVDWGGGCSVDEASAAWLDVSGGSHDCDFTLAEEPECMAREMCRTVGTLDTRIGEIVLTRRGSYATVYVSSDSDLMVGEVLTFQTDYNSWTGQVEEMRENSGAYECRLIGIDEQSKETTANDVFADRATHQSDTLELESNLVYSATDGSGVAGSSYSRLNPKLGLKQDAIKHGFGWADKLLDVAIQDNTPFEVNRFHLISRKKSMKDSASEVTVYGYSDTNIPYQQSGMAGGATVYALDYRPVEVIEVLVGGAAVYTGFRVDCENQQLIFDASTGGVVDITYTHRDTTSATASDEDVEAELGKKKKIEVWVGYVGSTPLQQFADSLIRGSYWVLTIKPATGQHFQRRWYPGLRIRINITSNLLKVNGYYYITRVIFEGSLTAVPRLEVEEYDDSATYLPPHAQPLDITDVWEDEIERTKHVQRGFFT